MKKENEPYINISLDDLKKWRNSNIGIFSFSVFHIVFSSFFIIYGIFEAEKPTGYLYGFIALLILVGSISILFRNSWGRILGIIISAFNILISTLNYAHYINFGEISEGINVLAFFGLTGLFIFWHEDIKLLFGPYRITVKEINDEYKIRKKNNESKTYPRKMMIKSRMKVEEE